MGRPAQTVVRVPEGEEHATVTEADVAIAESPHAQPRTDVEGAEVNVPLEASSHRKSIASRRSEETTSPEKNDQFDVTILQLCRNSIHYGSLP